MEPPTQLGYFLWLLVDNRPVVVELPALLSLCLLASFQVDFG
jgi:hypothetical protein